MKRTITCVDSISQQRLIKSRRLTDKLLDSYSYGVIIADARDKWRKRYDVVMDELKHPQLYKDFILDAFTADDLYCRYETMDTNQVDQDIADFFADLGGTAEDAIVVLDD